MEKTKPPPVGVGGESAIDMGAVKKNGDRGVYGWTVVYRIFLSF